jgi:hypothetical protein
MCWKVQDGLTSCALENVGGGSGTAESIVWDACTWALQYGSLGVTVFFTWWHKAPRVFQDTILGTAILSGIGLEKLSRRHFCHSLLVKAVTWLTQTQDELSKQAGFITTQPLEEPHMSLSGLNTQMGCCRDLTVFILKFFTLFEQVHSLPFCTCSHKP